MHARGITTWVSLEPVFSTAQTIEIVKLSHRWVDLYKVGVLNYLDEAKAVDWHDFAYQIVTTLNRLGKAYYIKQDLRKYLPAGAPVQAAAG